MLVSAKRQGYARNTRARLQRHHRSDEASIPEPYGTLTAEDFIFVLYDDRRSGEDFAQLVAEAKRGSVLVDEVRVPDTDRALGEFVWFVLFGHAYRHSLRG